MEKNDFFVDENIRKAQTISKLVYTDKEIFLEQKKKIFERSWQLLTDIDSVKIPGQYFKTNFVESYLEEPILITRDYSDKLHCLSNVCTHRGTILAEFNGHTTKHLRCRYHGRRFELDGKFNSMPEMEQAENFPCASDNLPKIPFQTWEKFIFVSLDPIIDFNDYTSPMQKRVGFLPLKDFIFDKNRSREYLVKANWALYVENYLEGFHVPYVHLGLAQELDYGSYRTELFPYCNLQVGISTGSENIFDLPESHPDYGQKIAAYYFWLFPNLMMNFYPWGLSINIVRPVTVNKTKVIFLTYVWKEDLLNIGAGAELDKVEREDEEVVEQVQQGVNSKFYKKGRYSPTREQGVHHFHRLLMKFLS